jgi:hypothetical protein
MVLNCDKERTEDPRFGGDQNWILGETMEVGQNMPCLKQILTLWKLYY